MSQKPPTVPIERRELWRAGDLAAMLSISVAIVYQLRKEEALPEPVRIRGAVAWRAQEIRDWLAAGCPDHGRWQWRRTLPQKLDDLLKDLHRQIAAANKELASLKHEIGRNEALLLEADAARG